MSYDKKKEVLDLIRKLQPVAKIDLINRMKLTSSTMTRILEELVLSGHIVEAGYGDSTGGRKPFLYEINPAFGYVIGLEISRAYSSVAIYDYNMNKLGSHNWLMPANSTSESFLPSITDRIEVMLDKLKISITQVIGMGIGSVKGWMNDAIIHYFEQRFQIPVTLDNGANTALIGEYWVDPAAEYQHVIYIHAGIGLRLSMMSDGVVLPRAIDQEDSFGQMIIQTDGLRLADRGNYGNLESYASIPALVSQLHQKLKIGRESSMQHLNKRVEDIGYPELMEALDYEDALAMEVITESACYFGVGLANVLNIMHPEKVILGGPIIHSHPLYYQVATQTALNKVHHSKAQEIVFSKGKLGEEALVYGAAILAVNKLKIK
jgi:predicted NBD/HSP70 family sugar kinase